MTAQKVAVVLRDGPYPIASWLLNPHFCSSTTHKNKESTCPN